MLLRNYDNIVAAYSLVNLNSTYLGDTTTFGDGHLNIKLYNGSLTKVNLSSSSRFPLQWLDYAVGQNYGASCIFLGSGNIPVTYDDYKLENELSTSQIAANSSAVNLGLVYDESSKTWTKTLAYDFLAKSDVTVSEIGVRYYSVGSNATTCPLIYREVLDTPVSLTNGQYLRVSITTTVSANPNKPADVSTTVETV